MVPATRKTLRNSTTVQIVRGVVGAAGLALLVSVGACGDGGDLGPTPGQRVVITVAPGSPAGSGSVRIQNVTQPTGQTDPFAIDCQITGSLTSGACSDTLRDIGGGGTVTLRASSINDTIVALGGSCAEVSGPLCSLSFTINEGDVTKTATFRVDTFAVPAPDTTAVVISDDFESAKAWHTELRSANGGATHSDSLSATGGESGGFRRMEHVLPALSSIVVYHRFDQVGYNPAVQGAITSVDYQESHRVFNPPFAGAAVGATFTIEQAGVVYLAPIPTFSSTSWEQVTLTGLTAGDFTPAPGPDFSASGAPMFFGFTRSNTQSANVAGGRVHGVDNWRVVVNR